ncbi:TonB family protein [Roseateles albus]|uniref:TonB family protein n=1 Tax=Roseateles albus TaxID=2987525 RepID=A0ABT5KFS3_9BURK|nr:TonB family protein [Roseateles albus]MDC8771810.1 TonB family protein [Roseateles albus]
MRRLSCLGPGLPCLMMVLLLAAGSARAQADGPLKPELSAEERAQRQAEKVFTFIKLQSVKPAAKRASTDALPATTSANAPASPPLQPANTAQAKPAANKPLAKPAVAVAAAAAGATSAAVEARPSAHAGPESPPVLLAAAQLTAAAAQPEPLPQMPSEPAEPEPPALQLLSKVEPEIPRQLQADFRGGAVTVRFMVQADGSVMQAQALQASHKRLALAAVTAVNQWRFAPLPLPREATVEIAFAVE